MKPIDIRKENTMLDVTTYTNPVTAPTRDYLVASLGQPFLVPSRSSLGAVHPVEIVFAAGVTHPAFAVALRLPDGTIETASTGPLPYDTTPTGIHQVLFGPFPRFNLAREAVDVALLHYDSSWLLKQVASPSYSDRPATLRELVRDILCPLRHSLGPTLTPPWSMHVTEGHLQACHSLIRAAALPVHRGY
jgi:hypothetical protein